MSGDDEILQRAQERLDKLRASAAPRRREAEAAPSPALAAVLGGLRMMSEAECAELDARRERYEAGVRVDVRAAALTPAAESAWLAACGVGLRHRELELQPDLVPAAMRHWAERAKRGASAILCGPAGSGKTASAIWAMRTLYRSGRAEPRGWQCPSAAFVTAGGLFARVFGKQPVVHFERVDLLVIDDWGRAYETDWPLAVVDELIDRRWSELRSTILTTNLFAEPSAEDEIPPEATLAGRYPRIYSRMCDGGGPGLVPLNRDDLRRRRA